MESIKKSSVLQRLLYKWYIPFLESLNAISSVLLSVSATQWWTKALAKGEDDFNRLLRLLGLKISSYQTYISDVQGQYSAWKENHKMPEVLEDEKAIIQLLSPNSALSRFLRRKGKNRCDRVDYKHHVYLMLWLNVRGIVLEMQNGINMNNLATPKDLFRYFYSILNTSNPEISNTRLGIENFLTNPEYNDSEILAAYPRTVGKEEMLELSKDKQDVVEKNYSESYVEDVESREDFEELSDRLEEFVSFYLEFMDVQLSNLFIYMNTDMLGVDSMEIVDLLRGKWYSKYIQQKYEAFCNEHPNDVIHFTFADTSHTKLQSVDFDWEYPADGSYFNLKWNWHQIQVLFDALLGVYIGRNTDVRDFCQALTGRQMSNKRKGKQVNWVHKEKQSLALFIGELRKRDQRHLKWKNLPNVFLYNGQDVRTVFSRMDVQCKQASDKGKFADLLEAIIKAEQYHPSIKEMLNGKGEA